MAYRNEHGLHDTVEWRRGRDQLVEWHMICRRKRLGVAEAERKLADKIREARNERDRERRKRGEDI